MVEFVQADTWAARAGGIGRLTATRKLPTLATYG